MEGCNRILRWAVVFWGALLLPSWGMAQTQVLDENQAPGRTMAQQATKGPQIWITADHSLHPVLQKTFTSGPEVTEACLSCHELAAGNLVLASHGLILGL